MPLEIALCITELDVGGAERCLVELAMRMDRQRFHPVVYCLGPPPRHDYRSLLPPLTRAGVSAVCLEGRSLWHFPWVLRRLKRLLASQKPQVLQTFLFHANTLGAIAARTAGVPHVATGIRVAERANRWHLWLARWTDRFVDRHVCVSRAVADFSAQTTRLPSEKLVVIPNGVDLSRFRGIEPANLGQFGIAPGRRAVTFVGRLERQKGVTWLVETAPRWMGRLPDCDLLLVGDGPEALNLERRRFELALGSRMFFAGWRWDVPEILAASSLLVLPSRWEGMSNVLLEAMASALPVVATDVEGVREALGTAAERQVAPAGDSQAFAERVVTMMRQPSLAAECGAENRRRVAQNYSIDRVVNAYERLWESLAAGESGA